MCRRQNGAHASSPTHEAAGQIRRCIDYFADRFQGFDGSFVDWLAGHGSGSEARPDRVVLSHAANVLLSSLVQQRASQIVLKTDLIDLVWVET